MGSEAADVLLFFNRSKTRSFSPFFCHFRFQTMHVLSEEALMRYWSFALKWIEFTGALCPPSMVRSS